MLRRECGKRGRKTKRTIAKRLDWREGNKRQGKIFECLPKCGRALIRKRRQGSYKGK